MTVRSSAHRLGPARGLSRAALLLLVVAAGRTLAQEPPAPQPLSEAQVQSAIDRLGDLDYAVRTEASRAVRRSPASQIVPALIAAVDGHRDGYVRYRALVLLTGFNDPRTADVVRGLLSSPNDRLRATAYRYLEHHRDLALVPELLAALDREAAEFVRPSLVRALAARADDARVRGVLVREVGRGEDFFRSAVIEALGDFKVVAAFDAVAATAALDGPLVDDAALALGKMGDPRARPILAGLQRTAPRQAQPLVAAGICLLGINCDVHERYLVETLAFADKTPGFQELVRSTAAALAALAIAGRESAAEALLAVGITARDATRAPVALATSTVALRNAPLALGLLGRHGKRADAIGLLVDGFEMLEEDFEKERFFASARRDYWVAAEGSPTRALMQTLIARLDF
jgi:HEAT repeat protein